MGKFGIYDIVPAAAGQTVLAKDSTHPDGTVQVDVGDFLGGGSPLPSGVQGDILYHDATEWKALTAGTNGQFLKTQGADADPVWATVPSGSGGPTNIAFISIAYGSDDPVNHTYATLRGAYDNEPAGSVWIFRGDGDVFEIDNSAPMHFENITFLTEFESGAIFININESISGMLNIPYPNFLFYVTNNISSINLECRNTHLMLFLQNATNSVINSVSVSFVSGSNRLTLGDEFYSIEPHSEYIENINIDVYNCNLVIPIVQADKLEFRISNNSKVEVEFAACAYVYTEVDSTSELVCQTGTGFAITSYVGTAPGTSPSAFYTPYIFGKAKIILSVNPSITDAVNGTPDSYFSWYRVVGPEYVNYLYESVVKGEFEITFPNDVAIGNFDTTKFTSGMGKTYGALLVPFYAEVDENLKFIARIDGYSDLYQYADDYFWFNVLATGNGGSPSIEILRNNTDRIYVHWRDTETTDFDTKKLVYFTGFGFLRNITIKLDDLTLAKFSEDDFNQRTIIFVHDNINPVFGGLFNAKLINSIVLSSVSSNFWIYPLMGVYSGGAYADVIGWTHQLYTLWLDDPNSANHNFFIYKCRASTINYFWEGIGYVLIDGDGATRQANTINGLTQQNAGSALIWLAIATDYNKVENGFIDTLIFDGSYNVVTGTEITSGILDSGTDNFVDPVTNPGGNQWVELREISTPANPDTDRGRIYVKDDGGVTKPYFLDSAGTETNMLAGGSSLPAGVQGDVLYHNGTDWTILTAGTSGYFLKTQGAGADPVWDAAPGSGGGETNTASNIGTAGVGVYAQKVGVDLQFKNINAGSSKVTVTDDALNHEIDIDIAEAQINLSNCNNSTSAFISDITGESLDDLSDVTVTGAAQGAIIYNNGTNWVHLAAGTAGNVLQTNGAGANPSWETVPGGGVSLVSYENPFTEAATVVIANDLYPNGDSYATFDSTDYVSYSGANLAVGSNDFEFEFEFNPTAGANRGLFSLYVDNDNRFGIRWSSDASMTIICRSIAANLFLVTSTTTFTAGIKHRVRFTRISGVIDIEKWDYISKTWSSVKSTTSGTESSSVPTYAVDMSIGRYHPGSAYEYFAGTISLVRVVNGTTDELTVTYESGDHTDISPVGRAETVSGTIPVTVAEAPILLYVVETKTMYEYIASGASYTVDDMFVLDTAYGGTTRWVGISGKYIATSLAQRAFAEVATPSNPPANTMYLYAKDDGGGTTKMYTLDSTGTETELGAGGGGGAFTESGGLISETAGNYTATFLVGAPQTDDDTIAAHDKRMFFNKTKGAFRVGEVTSVQWDDTNVGNHSFAAGYNNRASGQYSAAFGSTNTITGVNSHAFGVSNTIAGNLNAAFGSSHTITGANNLAAGYGHTIPLNVDYCAALGMTNTCSGDYAMALGYYCTANFPNDTVIGAYTHSKFKSGLSMASGRFSVNGDAQFEMVVMRVSTTTDTANVLMKSGTAGDGVLAIANNRLVSFRITVVAATSGMTDSAKYIVEGLIVNDGGTTAFLGGTPTPTTVYESDASWDFTVAANDTTDTLDLQVTGAVGKTIRWVAFVETVAVTY